MASPVPISIVRIPNRNSPPAVLLRESYRKERKVKKRTLTNLSALPEEQIEVLCRCLKGQTLILADEEEAFDGIYVVRTRLPAEELEAGEAVAVSWWLSEVERAFPVYKGVDLKVRPIHHWRGESGPGPRFPLPLAYYIEWHMKGRLESTRSGENGDGEHSFPTLLSDLATLTRNTGRVDEHNTFDRNSRPTELQQRSLDRLEVRPQFV